MSGIPTKSEALQEIKDGFQSAKLYTKMYMEINEAEKQRTALEKKKEQLTVSLGAAIEAAGQVREPGALAEVRAAREQIAKAEVELQAKNALVQQAQQTLAAAAQKNEAALAALQGDAQHLSELHKTAAGQLKEVQGRQQSIHEAMRKAEQEIADAAQGKPASDTAEALHARIGDLRRSLEELEPEVVRTGEAEAAARRTSEAKAAELGAAREAWKRERAEQEKNQKAASEAGAAAEKALNAAQESIRGPHLRLGKGMMIDSGARPEALAGQIDEIRQAAEQIERIGQEIETKRAAMQKVKGSAKRFTMLAGGALALLILLIFGFMMMGGSGPTATVKRFFSYIENDKPEKAIELMAEFEKIPKGSEGEQYSKILGKALSDQWAKEASKLEYVGESIDGDKAKVEIRLKGEKDTKPINLVKRNGKWLIENFR